MRENNRIFNLTAAGMFTAVLAVCAWVSVPSAVPFTLQTFAVFLAAGLLGAKYATLSVLCYIAIGAAGLPVFSGFGGGLGVLAGPTGGYIIGFVPAVFVAGWLYDRLKKRGIILKTAAFACGLIICYAFGTAWFMLLHANGKGVAAALTVYVLPFIFPDAVKLFAAAAVCQSVGKRFKN